MRDQLKNTAAACACTPCLFFVQVMVCLTPHAFSIKTTGSQLPQSELHVFTKETDTKKAKSRVYALSFVFPFFSSERDFDALRVRPWAGG